MRCQTKKKKRTIASRAIEPVPEAGQYSKQSSLMLGPITKKCRSVTQQRKPNASVSKKDPQGKETCNYSCEPNSGSTSQPCAKKIRAFFVRLSFEIE